MKLKNLKTAALYGLLGTTLFGNVGVFSVSEYYDWKYPYPEDSSLITQDMITNKLQEKTKLGLKTLAITIPLGFAVGFAGCTIAENRRKEEKDNS